MQFNKPSLSIDGQIAKLRSRGLLIPDDAIAAHYLTFIGYYRLSAYSLILQSRQTPDKPFKPGTEFEHILRLYRFDRELRLLTMDAIERIEVAVRAAINNEMCVRHGPHWFMNPAHFVKGAKFFKHDELLDRIDEELGIPKSDKKPARPHNEVFINHYFSKYTDPYLPPAWMIAETLTLGSWSAIFDNLQLSAERKAIASPFKVDEIVLRTWFHTLTYIRNICAHHARLWNRQLVIKPTVAKQHAALIGEVHDRFYTVAVIIHHLMQIIAPGTGWHLRLAKLIDEHPFVKLFQMGFPVNWKEQTFWSFQPPTSKPEEKS